MLAVVPGAVLALLGGYLVTLAVASLGATRARVRSIVARPARLTVLIPAHDEQQLVGRCVASLLAQTYPRDAYSVVVIADNCSDGTAAVATAAGAVSMVRDEPAARGKGRALRWAMDRLLAAPDAPDAFVIVDADSVAAPEMLAELAGELALGHEAVQADYELLRAGKDASDLADIGFVLFHRVRLGGRARLGMAANLVGNGMLLSSALLRRHPWDAFTGVEDLEYSMRLRLAGVRPRFAAAAHVAGPGSATRAGARKQRARWEGGRFFVMRRYLPRLVVSAVTRRDPSLLDAALDLTTPPLALLSMLAAAGTVIAAGLVLAGLAPWWVLGPWVLALAAVPAFVVVGLRSAGVPGSTWAALVRAPRFIVWKAMTYATLLRGHDEAAWERTDRVAQ